MSQERENKDLYDEQYKNSIFYVDPVSRLLDQKSTDDYLLDWLKLLEETKKIHETLEDILSFVLFRIYQTWMAIEARFFKEIASVRLVHRLPSVWSYVKGVVNIRGEVLLCIKLDELIGLSKNSKPFLQNYPRVAVCEDPEKNWAFIIDEVFGVVHYKKEQVKVTKEEIFSVDKNYIKGFLPWNGKDIAVIDHELLSEALRRNL